MLTIFNKYENRSQSHCYILQLIRRMVVPHKPHFFRHVSDCDHAYHVQVHVSENGYVLREKALYPSLIEHIEQFFSDK